MLIQERQRSVIALTIILLIALFGWNGVLELRAEEPRRAIVALEMYLSGNYWTPRIHGWPYYNKPPLFNWLLSLCYAMFGASNEWVVRFPSLVAWFVTALITALAARKHIGRSMGWLAFFIVLTTGDILFYGAVNAGEIDLFYSFLVILQTLAIFRFYENGQYMRLFLVSYALCALGFLTKGPPSLAFQAITLVAWFVVNRSWRLLFRPAHVLGIAVFFGITGAYFGYYGHLGGDSWAFITRLLKEASQRSAAESQWWDLFGHLFQFPVKWIQLLFPWSLLFWLFFRADIRQRLSEHRLALFAAVFILSNIPLYWITSGVKMRYLYMFVPFAAILLATAAHWTDLRSMRRISWLRRGFGLLLIILSIAVWFLLSVEEVMEFEYVQWVIPLFSVVLAALAWWHYRRSDQSWLAVVAALIALRLLFNLTYLPTLQAHSQSLKYRAIQQFILDITGESQIRWTGEKHVLESEIRIGPVHLWTANLTTPPLMAYQIPYYITRANGQILRYVPQVEPGHFYLAPKAWTDSLAVTPLYQYHEGWANDTIVLFRVD